MDLQKTVGRFGTVNVKGVGNQDNQVSLSFNIIPLEIGELLTLESELKALVLSDRDAQRNKQLSEAAAMPANWATREFVAGIVRYVMEPVTAYDVNAKRYDLVGIQSELWHLAKKCSPDLTRNEVAAVVTLDNCLDVRKQIDAVINPETASGQTATKS